ncbi:hypothetical protein NKH77_32975 [Streptomyces sp. M19]
MHGAFSPKDEGGRARDRVRVDEAVVDVGDRVDVVLKPGGHEAVRTGATGILHAWVPLGGALLLAALLVAGGLRMRRTGWGWAGGRRRALRLLRDAGVVRDFGGFGLLARTGPVSVPGRRRERTGRRTPGGLWTARPVFVCGRVPHPVGGSAGVAQPGGDTVDGEQQGAGQQRVGLLARSRAVR